MPTNRVTTHGPLSAAFRNREEMLWTAMKDTPNISFIEKKNQNEE